MSPVPHDPKADLVEQLQSQYEQNKRVPSLSSCDMERWTEIVGSTRHHAYDVLARYLAVGFHEGRFSFWFCDGLANSVMGFMYDDYATRGDEFWPSFFYKVYLAFDAGEVGNPGVDPIETFTRPMIADIVHELADNAG